MYVRIDKEWFDKNQKKFTDRAVKDFGNDPKQYYLITDEEVQEAETKVIDIDKKYGVQLEFSCMHEEIQIFGDWKPTADSVVAMVSDEMDNIKGDALVKIVELLIKRLNKFKTLIESLKGL